MSESLLPCLFCGGEASMWDRSPYDVCVRCDKCNIQSGWLPTVKDAIAAWNRRADHLPVVRGEWMQKHHIISLDNVTLTGTYPTCNLCDYAEVGMAKNTNYCPNCGAKMEDKS